jgi:hypothetical protein
MKSTSSMRRFICTNPSFEGTLSTQHAQHCNYPNFGVILAALPHNHLGRGRFQVGLPN